ncbi:hypothetical protein GGE39_005135 [Rhizobium leguminosarum]|nr:hypothetical protein [Rhizobium leguminosarum]
MSNLSRGKSGGSQVKRLTDFKEIPGSRVKCEPTSKLERKAC